MTIEVSQRTIQTVVLTWPQSGGVPSTISGWNFKLTVKRALSEMDANKWMEVAGSVVNATDRTFQFALTTKETTLPIGTWPGEIRAWEGAVSGYPAHRKTVDFIVSGAVKVAE